ncbi:MAG: Xaa-Pro peptidase family protein [Paracoccaceae bacterium]|nr:Xaa-Pro peptidase family protein [Paracoccaceae bacterium]
MKKREFKVSEFEMRMARAQEIMHRRNLDAILVTTPQNIRYFTGFDSQFWESPTRPWFVVVPGEGKPIAVVPEIGASEMKRTWVEDVRSWPSPIPEDDGISLLSDVVNSLATKFNTIGAELGREMTLRMPVNDFLKLRTFIKRQIIDGSPALWEMRMVKTESEIQRIGHICKLASESYQDLPKYLNIGETERDAVRKLRIDLTKRGADSIPFLPAVSGEGGVSQIVCGPSDRKLENGDILFMDTGSTYDGYFCDFDRNFAIGKISDEARKVHDLLWKATESGIAASVPGMTTEDVWFAMNKVIEEGSVKGNNAGRLGHGVGLQLTEPPSHRRGDKTKLVPNMVITIEPGLEYLPGKMLVHEENIVVTEDGPKLLTIRAPREMPVIT